MKQQLGDSLFQVIQALSPEEQAVSAQQLGATVPEPTHQEMIQFCIRGSL